VWIITAWQRISSQVTAKGFVKCCASGGMDETNDEELWNDSEESVNVKS